MVATTTQIADFARNVGGNAVDVHQILQPNTDPHEYEPRPGDVTATAGAKLVLENGDNLDAWMGKVVSESGADARVWTSGPTCQCTSPARRAGRRHRATTRTGGTTR